MKVKLMTWKLKKRNADGSVAEILKDIWEDAVRDADEFHRQGHEAWVEEVNGKTVYKPK
jgi:hypothetical protein